MMKSSALILFFFCAGVLVAQAILPRDAQFRKKEALDYRSRKLAEYEQASQHHEAVMISKEQSVRQELSRSPWQVESGRSGDSTIGTVDSRQTGTRSGRQGLNWLWSVLALVLLGGGVWCVKIATDREPDQ
jgi:hypothetical protein